MNFKFKFLAVLVFALQLALPSHALFGFGSKKVVETEIPHDNLAILVSGDIETLVKKIEKENKFDWEKEKISISNKDAELYGSGLVVLGDIDKAERFLNIILKKFKDQEIKDIKKHIDFFRSDFDHPELNYSQKELAQINLLRNFPTYLSLIDEIKLRESDSALGENSNPDLITFSLEELKNKSLTLEGQLSNGIEEVDNQTSYFPTKLEYLLELGKDEQARKEALEIINDEKEKLFPKTPDFNALAFAHRTLAILANKDGDEVEAERHFRLALLNIAKLRTAWLEEDIFTGKYLKERHTKVGYVLPQWIIFLRAKFEKEYSLLSPNE